MSTDEFLLEIEEHMDKTVGHVQGDLRGLRTGKATPGLVDNITVEAYGGTSRLKDLAGISAPEPRLLVIQPWDASIADDIVKAISKANVGITPMRDGKIIRMPIPELSDERRSEMKKLARKIAEEGRVAVRNSRRDGNEKAKKALKDGDITEDDKRHFENEVQELTDKYIKKIDAAVAAKEKELEEL